MRHERAPFAIVALRIAAGVIVWAAHFTVIYGYTGLACARRFDGSASTWLGLVPWVIATATLAAIAVIVMLIRPALSAPGRSDFANWLSAGLALLALAAIVLEALAAAWMPICR
jgi:hypothetical protein